MDCLGKTELDDKKTRDAALKVIIRCSVWPGWAICGVCILCNIIYSVVSNMYRALQFYAANLRLQSICLDVYFILLFR
jgi:hypothetical protein